jgi:Domain of unknown function (DUF1906)
MRTALLHSTAALSTISLVALSLTAVGCGSNRSGDPTGTSSSASSDVYGVDYSFSRPSPKSTKAQGYKFVARYLSGDPGSGKDITRGEADSLIDAGLDVVLVWEADGTAAQDGYDQGVRDARAARDEAASVGQPSSRPIYFAVDFDPSGFDGIIGDYFDGVASVLGVKRTGAYAGYGAIHSLFDGGKIGYGWQTYAWSDGEWDGRAHLRQIDNGIDGDSEDLDEAIASDYGQWPDGAASPPPPPPLSTTAIGVNADGRLEAFSRGGKNAVFDISQTSPGGGWSGWGGLGGQLTTDPAVALNSSDRLEVFAVGENKAMYHQWVTSSGAWSGWDSLGGEFLSAPAVTRNTFGKLEVFARGDNSELYHAWLTDKGTWSAWSSLGGTITSRPSVVLHSDGHLEVFARGDNDTPFHIWQTTAGGAWSKWASLGGSVTSEISVAVNADGRVEIFAVGKNQEAYHDWLKDSGDWSGWASLGGTLSSSIAATTNADGRLEIFARGADNKIFHIWQTEAGGGWSGWESLGGELSSNPSVGVNDDGRLELFARGGDDHLYHIWQTEAGGGWSGWSSLGGTIQ